MWCALRRYYVPCTAANTGCEPPHRAVMTPVKLL